MWGQGGGSGGQVCLRYPPTLYPLSPYALYAITLRSIRYPPMLPPYDIPLRLTRYPPMQSPMPYHCLHTLSPYAIPLCHARCLHTIPPTPHARLPTLPRYAIRGTAKGYAATDKGYAATDKGYGASREGGALASPKSSLQEQRVVGPPIRLRARYAAAGTDLVYAGRRRRSKCCTCR